MNDADQREWIAKELERCRPFLLRAIELTDGTCDFPFVASEIDVGNAQLWPGQKSALVTKIDLAPTGIKTLTLWLAGGEIEEVAHLQQAACAWGKKMGCTRAVIIGRRGWLRALEGFRESQTVMTKDL